MGGLVEGRAGMERFTLVPSPGTCVAAECSWQHRDLLSLATAARCSGWGFSCLI